MSVLALKFQDPIEFARAKDSGNCGAYLKGFASALVSLVGEGESDLAVLLFENSELGLWHFKDAGCVDMQALEILWRRVGRGNIASV